MREAASLAAAAGVAIEHVAKSHVRKEAIVAKVLQQRGEHPGLVHVISAIQIATFLGRQITPQLAQALGSQFSAEIEGTCIKHRFGDASIKMCDKFGQILRIETTTNDMSFFKHHRKVASVSLAPAKLAKRQGDIGKPRQREGSPR